MGGSGHHHVCDVSDLSLEQVAPVPTASTRGQAGTRLAL